LLDGFIPLVAQIRPSRIERLD
jgi:hypothetical protein